jgi:DNA-binding XRE family transcriptional regulator
VSTVDDKRLQVAARLREAREYLGLSQDDVAAALQLSRPAVTNIESGTRKVDALELEQLADLYGRSVQYFLGAEDALPASKIAFAARTLKGLSDSDLAEVARFAEFLRTSSKKKQGRA